MLPILMFIDVLKLSFCKIAFTLSANVVIISSAFIKIFNIEKSTSLIHKSTQDWIIIAL